MKNENIRKEFERKILVRKYANENVLGVEGLKVNLEERIINASDSAQMPLLEETDTGSNFVIGFLRKIQKKYINVLWAWYFNMILMRQTRYNIEMIDIVQELSGQIDALNRKINLLEKISRQNEERLS